MIKKFGDLHKLRVLNFDAGDKKENIIFQGESSKPGNFNTQNFINNLKYTTNEFIGKCSKWGKTKSSSETSFKGSSRRPRRSNIFKRPSNSSKRTISKRSVSLYNLKQNLSSTSFFVTNPIKRSLKTETSFKRKQDKHYNNTDVQVLFMSETRKAHPRFRKPKIYEDKRKLDWINNSNSSDLVNCKSNEYNSNKNYQSHENKNILSRHYHHDDQHVCKFKQYENNNRDPNRINDHTINIKPLPYSNNMPMSYNLIDFSCAACKIETPYDECFHKISTIDPCPCLDKQVWVETPCQKIKMNSSENSDNKLNKNDADSNENININIIEGNEQLKRCVSKDQIRLPLCSQNLNNPESLAKLALKYILIVIAIIVWSPCILLMCIYWLVSYPVRPPNILKKRNISKDNMFGSYGCCACHCRQYFSYLFAIIYGKVNSSYNTLFALIKKEKSKESQNTNTCVFKTSSSNKICIKNNRNLCPNPKNKYTLYYTRNRGWLMKPLKKRRRTVSKKCECHNDEFSSTKENSKKKMRDQYCECFPKKLKDKIRTLSRPPSQKTHPKVLKSVSTKSSPVSFPGQPPKICYADATTMPLPDLNKDCHQEPAQNWQMKPRKNVSFGGNHLGPLDLCDPINNQIMSPQLNAEKPFCPNTLQYKEFVSRPSFKKKQNLRSECECEHIKTRKYFKRTTPFEQNQIHPKCPKYINTRIRETAPCLNIKPKSSYYKNPSKNNELTKKNQVICFCKTARKNVQQVVHNVENDVWKYDCYKDMYIHTLRRKPCFWIYRRCSSFYPYFLIFYRFYEKVVIGLLFIISTCIWVPILCWCYLCFSLFCRCFKC